MTAVLTGAPAVPAPGSVGDTATRPAGRPRREHPRSEYWDVFEACWRSAAR